MAPARPAQDKSDLRRAERLYTPQQPGLRLIEFRSIVKGSLRGFATVELPIGLKIHDVVIVAGSRGCWANMPSRPQIDQDGRQPRNANGKPRYSPTLEWRDRDLANRFSAAVIAAIRAAHPDALPNDGGS